MTLHYPVTLLERLTVVERSLAFLGVVGYYHVEVLQGYFLLVCGLHDTDAPVYIS